jgi:transcriptional regulator with XRE-family HTH domain
MILSVAKEINMVRRNVLANTPPFSVEKALKVLGENLKIARLRRDLSIKDVADKIGTGTRVIRDAEQGKPTTSVVVYMALLWAYDLLQSVDDVANPLKDEIGLRLEEIKKPQRSKSRKVLDNDF